jgi:hypothetical protein
MLSDKGMALIQADDEWLPGHIYAWSKAVGTTEEAGASVLTSPARN